MPIDPLKNLSILNKTSGSQQTGRAQNFSATNLGRNSVKDAKVSMSQAMGSGTKKSTSISHPEGYAKDATTSISRPQDARHSISPDEMTDEERDDRRYNYIRRLVMARKKKEEAEKLVEEASKETGGIYQQTIKKAGFTAGKLKRVGGVHGMKMKLRRMIMKNPETYKNISAKDREYIFNLIDSHAGKVRTGQGFNRLVRKSMKYQVQRDWKKGIISKQDAMDIKKMVDELP